MEIFIVSVIFRSSLRNMCTSYANIFMGKFENFVCTLSKKHSNFLLSLYRQYFFLWNWTESELIKFIGNLKHPTVKFKIPSIISSDAKIFKNQNGILSTTIYKKPNENPTSYNMIQHTQNSYETLNIQSSITYKTNVRKYQK